MKSEPGKRQRGQRWGRSQSHGYEFGQPLSQPHGTHTYLGDAEPQEEEDQPASGPPDVDGNDGGRRLFESDEQLASRQPEAFTKSGESQGLCELGARPAGGRSNTNGSSSGRQRVYEPGTRPASGRPETNGHGGVRHRIHEPSSNPRMRQPARGMPTTYQREPQEMLATRRELDDLRARVATMEDALRGSSALASRVQTLEQQLIKVLSSQLEVQSRAAQPVDVLQPAPASEPDNSPLDQPSDQTGDQTRRPQESTAQPTAPRPASPHASPQSLPHYPEHRRQPRLSGPPPLPRLSSSVQPVASEHQAPRPRDEPASKRPRIFSGDHRSAQTRDNAISAAVRNLPGRTPDVEPRIVSYNPKVAKPIPVAPKTSKEEALLQPSLFLWFVRFALPNGPVTTVEGRMRRQTSQQPSNAPKTTYSLCFPFKADKVPKPIENHLTRRFSNCNHLAAFGSKLGLKLAQEIRVELFARLDLQSGPAARSLLHARSTVEDIGIHSFHVKFKDLTSSKNKAPDIAFYEKVSDRNVKSINRKSSVRLGVQLTGDDPQRPIGDLAGNVAFLRFCEIVVAVE